MVKVRLVLLATLSLAVLVGCGTSSAGGTTTGAGNSAPTGCPEATLAEATVALGKPAQQGVPEGRGRCFFAAADTHGASATEYVRVTVTRHSSSDAAQALFQAASGTSGTSVNGLGDDAVFAAATEGGTITAIKGSVTVQVDVRSKSQAHALAALKKLCAAVLAGI
jgi:hypothetical protein